MCTGTQHTCTQHTCTQTRTYILGENLYFFFGEPVAYRNFSHNTCLSSVLPCQYVYSLPLEAPHPTTTAVPPCVLSLSLLPLYIEAHNSFRLLSLSLSYCTAVDKMIFTLVIYTFWCEQRESGDTSTSEVAIPEYESEICSTRLRPMSKML